MHLLQALLLNIGTAAVVAKLMQARCLTWRLAASMHLLHSTMRLMNPTAAAAAPNAGELPYMETCIFNVPAAFTDIPPADRIVEPCHC
jgi:hypothetical protein